MPYQIFFSYRRADYGPPMQSFFERLSEAVRMRLGLDRDAAPAFFDQEGIETGDNWDDALAGALRQSRVLIPLYSPAYFKSEYCGKEWQCFQLRREAHAAQHGGGEPPAIMPVVWIPNGRDGFTLTPALPQRVHRVQYTWGKEDSDLNRKGLDQILRRRNTYNDLYEEFIADFAQRIADRIEAGELAGLDPWPSLAQLESAFCPNVVPPAPAPPGGGPTTPCPPATRAASRRVCLVYAALDPASLGAGRSDAAYLDAGGSDWRPFYPKHERRIGAMAAHIVSDPELDYEPDAIALPDDLGAAVRAAGAEGKVVLVFVDRWSMQASVEYRDRLRAFDAGNFDNCAVILPWNPDDPELASHQADFDQTLAEVLQFRSKFDPSTPFACKHATTEAELRATLQEVLNQLQAEMRRRAPVRPLGPALPRPTVSGPGATP
jgi:FxsC-like protein